MDAQEKPQIYLLTPQQFELSTFRDLLAQVLDAHAIACVRLDLVTRDEDRISRAADALREVCHARDVAIVVSEHTLLSASLGLDGVHLPDAGKSIRDARKTLGDDAIVGAFCGTSRHDGMTAAEAGADYVSFGPLAPSTLGTGEHVEKDVFDWWSEMIEVPCVAEGNIDKQSIATLWDKTDFFAIGEEIWRSEQPSDALTNLKAEMG